MLVVVAGVVLVIDVVPCEVMPGDKVEPGVVVVPVVAVTPGVVLVAADVVVPAVVVTAGAVLPGAVVVLVVGLRCILDVVLSRRQIYIS